MAFTKITQSELNSRGATTLPDKPTISTSALKAEFDAPAKEIVAPDVNRLINELEATTSAASLGAVAPTGRTGNTVQAVLNSVSSAVDNKSYVQVSPILTSGVKIAVVSIDGSEKDLYAPTGGGGGTSDYPTLTNKPSINSVTLIGNKTSSDLSLAAASHTHTTSDITDLSIPDELADLSDDATHRLVTDTEKTAWNGKSTVSWSQNVTTGQKIATVTIDGTPTDVYAPTGGGGGGGAVDSVNGQTGTVVLDVDDINDVVVSSLANNDALMYDSSATKWKNKALAAVALSNSYNDLTNQPTIPTITDTYDGTSSNGMSGIAVKSAIDALDGTVSGTAGAGKTVTALSQTDGKISATFGDISITKSQVSDFPTIPTVSDTYSGTSSDAMSGKAVKAAMESLDGTVTGTPATSKTLSAFSQSDGKVTATFSSISITKSQISNFPDLDEWFETPSPVAVDANGEATFTGVDDTKGYAFEPYFNSTTLVTISAIQVTYAGTSSMQIKYTTNAANGTTVKLRIIK